MKILVVHNFHRTGSASGDDEVFKLETAMLQAHGHEVIKYTVTNDEFDSRGIIGKIISAFSMLWSFKNYRAIREIIKTKKPDLMHIHTFFPLLSPSVLYAAKKSNVKVVATLHDTRFICPCSTSLRGTTLCNKCGDGNYFRMLKYACFKNSRWQSLVVAFIFTIHRIFKTFYKQIDKYICLNDNQINLLVDIGYDKNKIIKKYNFIPERNANIEYQKDENLPERYVVFYGRIGEEKGIRILMQIWDKIPNIPLVVMGGGPLANEFETWAKGKKNVVFLGYCPHDKCLAIVKDSEFVVFPSIWYEGCSMVQIEAQSLGKALVATDLGFSIEAIENGYNGYKVPINDVDGFVDKINQMWNQPEKCIEMGKNAHLDYKKKYLLEDNYNQLMAIYNNVKD